MIRRPPIETKINQERWLVSYADFITLLFAFFVVMYSVSQVNEQKYRQLASMLESTFSSGKTVDAETQSTEGAAAPELADVTELGTQLQEALGDVLADEVLQITGNEQWVEIALDANLLFALGKADLSPEAKQVLAPMGDILGPHDNAISVAGHTDDIPINNSRFANNWELSSARAVAVVNFLAYQGVAPVRLSAVGFGEYRPLVENTDDTSRARNRRVVIKVANAAVPAQTQTVSEFEATLPEPVQDEIPNERAKEGPTAQIPETEVTEENTTSDDSSVPAVRLQGGGLLFSSDPDLPRTNPPVTQSQVTEPPVATIAPSVEVP